jgi:hypothetical protein
MRFASNAIFQYSADVLAFGAVPWTLVVALGVQRRWRERQTVRGLMAISAVAGLAAGSLYVLKYSAVFVTIAVLLWFLHRLARTHLVRLATLCLAAALPVAGLSAMNAAFGGSANLVTASVVLRWRWESLLHAVANPALMLADAGSLWRWVLLHPTHGVAPYPVLVTLIGLPGGVALLWLVLRERPRDDAEALATCVLLTSVALMVIVWSVAAGADFHERHLAPAALAALPLVLSRGTASAARAGRAGRTLLALGAGFYLLIPLAYGVVTVIGKVWRTPRYVSSEVRLYNPLLARYDLASVRAELMKYYVPQTDVWYVPDPLTALDIPGRAIQAHADFEPPEELARRTYRTSVPLRVQALLPPKLEDNGKGPIIRASFPQAEAWQPTQIAGSEYVLWTTILRPKAGRVRP